MLVDGKKLVLGRVQFNGPPFSDLSDCLFSYLLAVFRRQSTMSSEESDNENLLAKKMKRSGEVSTEGDELKRPCLEKASQDSDPENEEPLPKEKSPDSSGETASEKESSVTENKGITDDVEGTKECSTEKKDSSSESLSSYENFYAFVRFETTLRSFRRLSLRVDSEYHRLPLCKSCWLSVSLQIDQDDSPKNEKKSTGQSKTVRKTGEESSRFKRMRRLAAVAGLRFKYKQLEGIKSESKKYRILKDFMIEHGVTKFSLKACKEYRLKKEEEAEVAELMKNEIIDAESTKRVTRGSRRQMESEGKPRRAFLETFSSSSDSEREKMIEENGQVFSRLKGIVSDDSKSCLFINIRRNIFCLKFSRAENFCYVILELSHVDKTTTTKFSVIAYLPACMYVDHNR
ncbi:unnamed protein product [Enterobius vermicularis]|uniref:Uncharacterized protein n=1 Tax=Enterobius vermicularis TaxID=51028 RepID=A0A0N4VMH2_ENTVE|nr:unnamed protein product [Enterobius vermicularis]